MLVEGKTEKSEDKKFDDKPKMPEFSPTRGGFEIGATEPTPKAKGEQAETPSRA